MRRLSEPLICVETPSPLVPSPVNGRGEDPAIVRLNLHKLADLSRLAIKIKVEVE